MKKIFSVLLSCCLLFGALTFVACGKTATVESIEITKNPTKVTYKINETFSIEGGELTATLSDGTTEVISLVDEAVAVSVVNTATSGNKSVTVTYKDARARFSVTVEPIKILFDLGDIGATAISDIELKKVGTIEMSMPDDPTFEGYEFGGWFTDSSFTDAFVPTREITADTTLYAQWLDVRATYFNVLFDGNYYGAKAASVQKVEEGSAASPARALTRNGYSFDGWFTEKSGGTEYAYGAVTEDVTVYAHWTRTMAGTETWTFEAEELDFTGKQGLAYSGATSEKGMIQSDSTGTSSGGLYVGYNYTQGMKHEFRIVSDREVSDATVHLRLSAEFASIFLTPDTFTVEINGVKQQYSTIMLVNVPENAGEILPFADFLIATDAVLKEGANVITLTVSNNDPPTDAGGNPLGTMRASAPLIDCVKITTSAALYWDGTFDMPGPLPR